MLLLAEVPILLRKIQYCTFKMLKNNGLVISHDLLKLNIVKCAHRRQTSLPDQSFLFWHFNITPLINSFGGRF